MKLAEAMGMGVEVEKAGKSERWKTLHSSDFSLRSLYSAERPLAAGAFVYPRLGECGQPN